MPSSTYINVSQSICIDPKEYSKEEIELAIQSHNDPDPYLTDESFPGSMKWEINDSDYSDGSFTRNISFTFSWNNDDEIENWAKDNSISLNDSLLPSYIVGDYEGLNIGEDNIDYEDSYG